ncbi:hypothetical protein niasHS_009954 [Heterodera schachtii]|uniref:RING-type domain-containing protein n=1 Tax=Heterodera schachtii TaxID=97005 RepID=A0ABD2JD05_HETSC
MNENRQTLADLIAVEHQKEKANPSTDRKGKTLAELFNDIDDNEFGQFLRECRENELLIGTVYNAEQNVQTNQLKFNSQLFNKKKDKLEGMKQQTEEQLEKKLQNLKSIKQKDPVMSQIMESLANFTKELKSGNHSDILMENLRSLLFSSIEICAKREKIPMSEIKTKEKFGIKSFAKLIKLLLVEKLETNKQKKDKKYEKPKNSEEKQKLKLMYTAVDNLNIAVNIKNEPDKKNKRNRRKKRSFVNLMILSLACIVAIICICYLCYKIGPWLVKNANSIIRQQKVSEAVSTIPEHTVIVASSDQCPICLEDYQSGDKVRTLRPCKHKFHSDCIGQWTKKQKRCPSCRAPVDWLENTQLNNTGHPNNVPIESDNAQNSDNAVEENV